MAQIAFQIADQSSTKSSATTPIDLGHLTRMSMGDRSLEREILQLFDRQAAMLMMRISTASPALVFSLAHTLKNSAQSIGAWHVAHAAEAVELADGIAAEAEFAQSRLAAAVEEARRVIAELLRAH